MTEKANLYTTITNELVEALEGGVKPWVCPWDRSGAPFMPHNFHTKAQYRGINIVLLWMRQNRCGYQSSAWLTYKQARAIGGQVRKGEKATTGIFYKTIEVPGSDSGEEESRIVPVIKPFYVFNLDQIDGIELPTAPATREEFAPIAQAEAMLARTGARIETRGEHAFYAPTRDVIVLPERSRFARAEDFYATATHELTHWTGHKSRLGRFVGVSYAFEELVAEIGSAFINAEIGLQGDLQHANYLNEWLTIMKGDHRAIFKAASLASQAHQFVCATNAPCDSYTNVRDYG